MQATMTDCIACHKKIKEKLAGIKNNFMEDVMELGITFGKQSKLYLDFLQNVYQSSEKVSNSFFDDIWNIYCLEQLSSEHSGLLWEVLRKENRSMIGFSRTKTEAAACFKKYFTDPKMFIIKTITLPAFACFLQIF